MAYPTFAAPRYYGSITGGPASKIDQQRTDEEKAKDCQKYLMVLAEMRLPWEPMIDNIIAYVNHGRRFINDKDTWPGQQTGQEVYDDSAMLARNKLRDGMVGNLCSRNMPWFGLELPGKFNFPRASGMRAWSGKRLDTYPQVQRWLQDTQDVMYSAFIRSNFYDIIPQFISDGATCGTAHLVVEEDVAEATTVFKVPHFRECYISENQWGMVDTNYRVYKMTLRQLVQKFGLDTMKVADPNFEREYAANMYAETEVLHAVYPRADYDPNKMGARYKKWTSEWVYRKGGKILEYSGHNVKTESINDVHALGEGGYDTMPIITWRWWKNDDETYGRGPAHDAFVAIAKANQMGRTNLITAHQAAEPPLIAYSDLRNSIQRGPAGITYLENNRGDIRSRAPMPLYTGVQQLPFNIEFQDRERQIINEHFFTDVFMLMTGLAQQGKSERMVDAQIGELQGEKAAILSTRVGRLQSEAFDPIIYRMFSIESAAGRVPEPPDILLESSHGPVQIQYIGPLSQAQTRLTKVRSITTGLQLLTNMAQINPTVIDAVDIDAAANMAMDAVGFPEELKRQPREIAAIRQQRVKQQQQAQMAENAPKLARAAASLSKAPEAGSIMKQLTDGGGSPEAPTQ